MITKSKFGTSDLFTIENGEITAEFISFGARIKKLLFQGKDVLLGYDHLCDYKKDLCYVGATIGRYGNRIANGKFTLNEKQYLLEKNENSINCHHGGFNGFDRFEWKGEILSENSLCFSRTSPDGEGGFPGNLEVKVTFTVEENAVSIAYFASSDQDTVVNLTSHAYFNLEGYDGGDCREMMLQLPAGHFLPLDDRLIPTGEIRSVQETEFDFTALRKITQDYDHCFVYGLKRVMRFGGSLYSPASKIRMDIETDMPGIQLYTCSKFEADCGKGGIPLHLHQGVALETQFFPDSPNHPHFPSATLKKGEIFESATRYVFTKE